ADNETFAYPKLFFDYPITSCAKTRICLETTRVDADTIPKGLLMAMIKRILNHPLNGAGVELVLLDTVTAIAHYDFVRRIRMHLGELDLKLRFRSVVVADEVVPLLPDWVRVNQQTLPLSIEYTGNGEKILDIECNELFKSPLEGLLIIGRNVTTVGENALDKCDKLTGVIVSNSVTELGPNCFSECTNMRIALMGESVTDIWDFCFGKCVDLEDVQLPDSLRVIHHGAFWACDNLEQIIIPDSVTRISRSVFDACTSLSEVSLPSDLTEIGSRTFHGCTSLETIVLPDTVEKIQGHAFEDCINLTSINIPRSLTTIYKHAFANCVNLRLTLREFGIKRNGDPFEGCPHVTFI
ncbi:MAG: leucine-rich repeat domain-containing protein, partial [Bacteroidaceae bacterium]|nr:leucine-rich repeat domain-containing protein [Bacteroidaceae bacterium]